MVIDSKDLPNSNKQYGLFSKCERKLASDSKVSLGPGPAAYNPLMSYKLAVSRRQPTYMYHPEPGTISPGSSLPESPYNDRASTGH